MENPQPLACSNIKPAYVPLVVAHGARRHAFAERRADNHHVFRNHRRGLNSYFSSRQIGQDFLIVVQLEVYFTLVAKGWDTAPIFRAEAMQPIARRSITAA